jgi:hypothetical protein
VIDDDLRIGMAADELDALVEPPGDVQVGRQGSAAPPSPARD